MRTEYDDVVEHIELAMGQFTRANISFSPPSGLYHTSAWQVRRDNSARFLVASSAMRDLIHSISASLKSRPQ